MKWTPTTIEKPVQRFELELDRISITVSEPQKGDNGKFWQYFMLSFGAFSELTAEECMKTWPREAIASARAQLDKFEAQLERGPNEAAIQ